MRRTMIEVFAGLGGFSCAAELLGVETICQVEIDDFLLNGLKLAYPRSAHWGDIGTFDGTPYRGRVWALVGGPPCQPISLAGKRRGASDDRWLWPETLRVLAEIRPAWALFENPLGIVTMGLDDIVSGMARCGYDIGLVEIPACAVGAFHKRQRIWILAHRQGCEGGLLLQPGRARQAGAEPVRCAEGVLVNAEGIGGGSAEPDIHTEPESREAREIPVNGTGGIRWIECHEPSGKVKFRAVPDCLPRLDAGISPRIRAALVAAFGNTIQWEIAAEIIRHMIRSEQ